MTFIVWLKKQTKRDDVVGDLAVDFIRSKSKARTYKKMENEMMAAGASYEAFLAMKEARAEWLRSVYAHKTSGTA